MATTAVIRQQLHPTGGPNHGDAPVEGSALSHETAPNQGSSGDSAQVGDKRKGAHQGPKVWHNPDGTQQGAEGTTVVGKPNTPVKPTGARKTGGKKPVKELKLGDEGYVQAGESFLNHTGEPMQVDSPSEPDDESIKITPEEEEEERRKLAEGSAAALRSHPGSRPKDVEALWKTIYIYIKGWWGKDGKPQSSTETRAIERIQVKLMQKAKDHAQSAGTADQIATRQNVLEKSYAFPIDTLRGSVMSLIAALDELNDLDHDVELTTEECTRMKAEEGAKFLQGVAIFVTKLQQWDIPAQSVLSQYAAKTFAEILSHSTQEAKDRYFQTLKDLEKPTEEQRETWEQALPAITEAIEVLGSKEPTDENKGVLTHSLELVRKQDTSLQRLNEELQIDKSVNSLPVDVLGKAQTAWSSTDQEALKAAFVELMEFLATREMATDLHQQLGEFVKVPAKKTLEPPPASSLEESRQKSFQAASQSPVTSTESSNTLFVHENDDLASLREAAAKDDTIQMFDYSDGYTEFGEVVTVRPSDNPRFCRIIVNEGTEDFAHHRVVKGGDLCPGGAVAMCDPENRDQQTIFDLIERKRGMKTTPGYIKSVGPCVIADQGAQKRRPDTYIKLVYINKDEEWLTRTEYSKLVGAKCSDRHIAQLSSSFARRTTYINECRRQGVHPGTGKPLTAGDRERYPWLLLNSVPMQGTSKSSSKKTTYEPELISDDAPDDFFPGVSGQRVQDGSGRKAGGGSTQKLGGSSKKLFGESATRLFG
jgi:hypothetical protein